VPGGAGTFDSFSPLLNNSSPIPPAINDAGDMVFRAGIIEPDGSVSGGIFRSRGNELLQLARIGQPTPSGSDLISGLFRNPLLNDAGQVAFMYSYSEADVTISDGSGILFHDGEGLTEIVRQGATVPNGNGQIEYFHGDPILNDHGQVAFGIALTGTDSGLGGPSDGLAIYRWANGELVEIVRPNQPLQFEHGLFANPMLAGMNDAGQIAFSSGLTQNVGSGDANFGIYLYDDSQGFIEIAQKGDSMLGSKIDELAIRDNIFLNYEFSPINVSGATQVAYHFTLADGRQGIAVWSLVPEPGCVVVVVSAAGWLALTRRRRSHN
jgi:hypothetical protein